MGYQVGLTEAAQADMEGVVRFLAEKSSEAAERIGNELLDAALSLTLFPGAVSPYGGGPVCASSHTATT